jgi:uncharacterized membrane-anchored protein
MSKNTINITNKPKKITKGRELSESNNSLLHKVTKTLREDIKISPEVSVKLQRINNEVIAHYHQVVNK